VPDTRQIFAFSGVIDERESGHKPDFALIDHALSLVKTQRRTRLCYIPTAVGDSQRAIDHYTSIFSARGDVDLSVAKLFTQPSPADMRAHLLNQDAVFVEGGSVVNLMALWQAHHLTDILAECWEAGVLLSGTSAGSLCWHIGGPTDSFSDQLDPFTDGMALLPYSNGVHDDFPDQPRRTTYRAMVADGTFPAGYASEDGVGLHYVGVELAEAVTIREGKHAWRVEPAGNGEHAEKPIEPRLI
jgi:peptidase E